MGKEIYISTDIENDGPIPGVNSMLSFASVALSEAGDVIGTFERNLELLEGAVSNADTMKWWQQQPAAWNAHRQNLKTPLAAITDYVEWIESLPGTPVFVAYPVGVDFMFMYWYMIKFLGKSPFGCWALDIGSFAAAVLKRDFRKIQKSTLPASWFARGTKNTHIAIDDAMEQGLLFINMLKESRKPF